MALRSLAWQPRTRQDNRQRPNVQVAVHYGSEMVTPWCVLDCFFRPRAVLCSSQGVLRGLDYLGTTVFAISGTITAGQVGMDLLGKCDWVRVCRQVKDDGYPSCRNYATGFGKSHPQTPLLRVSHGLSLG